MCRLAPRRRASTVAAHSHAPGQRASQSDEIRWPQAPRGRRSPIGDRRCPAPRPAGFPNAAAGAPVLMRVTRHSSGRSHQNHRSGQIPVNLLIVDVKIAVCNPWQGPPSARARLRNLRVARLKAGTQRTVGVHGCVVWAPHPDGDGYLTLTLKSSLSRRCSPGCTAARRAASFPACTERSHDFEVGGRLPVPRQVRAYALAA